MYGDPRVSGAKGILCGPGKHLTGNSGDAYLAERGTRMKWTDNPAYATLLDELAQDIRAEDPGLDEDMVIAEALTRADNINTTWSGNKQNKR
jgi:hypothetical protein